MATTIVQQAPAPAPPAANTDMMQMMMMNNMMQQQNEQSHQRAMEREHAHDHDHAKAAPTVVQVQAPAAPPPIPTGNCCGMELFSGLNCCSICQIVWMFISIGGLLWYSGWIAYSCSCEPWQEGEPFSWWSWEDKKNYAENVCFTDIDDSWWNTQTGRRRQLGAAAELFPVPGTDDISPAQMGVGGLVPVVPKPRAATTPEPASTRRRLHDASKCREVCQFVPLSTACEPYK